MPAKNSGSCTAEIEDIQESAARNNLGLNCLKSKEMIICTIGRPNHSRSTSHELPPPVQGIKQVISSTVLGVVINDCLTAADHVSGLLTTRSRLLHALQVLRSHGIPESSMHDVFRPIVVSRLLYCAPVWSGFCSAVDRTKLNTFLCHCQ